MSKLLQGLLVYGGKNGHVPSENNLRTQEVPLAIERDIVHGSRVSLQCPLKLSRLPVPYLDGRILTGGSKEVECWMERDLGHLITMARQNICCRCPRYPIRLEGSALGW